MCAEETKSVGLWIQLVCHFLLLQSKDLFKILLLSLSIIIAGFVLLLVYNSDVVTIWVVRIETKININ